MTKNPYLEKSSSFLGAAGAFHVGQNLATNFALGRKRVAQYLADAFTAGTKGVVDTSLGAKAARSATSVIVPDISAAHKAAHEAGGKLKDVLESATPRQRAAARMMIEGKFDKIFKYGLHEDPVVQAVHRVAQQKLPIPDLHQMAKSRDQVKNLQALWEDKSHPLLSNIARNIGRGKVPHGDNFKPGVLTQHNPVISSLALAPVEPAGAIIDGTKALAGSKAVQGNHYGKMLVDKIQNIFVNNPINHGWEAVKDVKGVGHQAYKYLGNPMSAHLKRTTASLRKAVDDIKDHAS